MDNQSFFLHDAQADLSHYLFNSDDKAHMHSNYFIVLFHIFIYIYIILFFMTYFIQHTLRELLSFVYILHTMWP